MLNKNEKSLLNFISCATECSDRKDNILKTVLDMGIEVNIKDFNPVYQIIDNLVFSSYKSNLIRK